MNHPPSLVARSPVAWLAGLLLWLAAGAAAAQALPPHQVKSAYLVRFFEYITWQDEGRIREFRIGVVGDDEALLGELRRASGSIRVKGRPFTVERVADLKQMPGFHLLYIARGAAPSVREIAAATRRSNTLLVSDDSREQRDFMINLVRRENGTIGFEVNRTNVVFEGLKLNIEILLLGGTELDVAELFKETEYELAEMKTQLTTREQDLSRLQAEVAERESRLVQQAERMEQQNRDIRAREERLSGLEQQLKAAGEQLSSDQSRLRETEQALAARLSDMQEAERDVERLTAAVAANTGLLSAQEQQLREQAGALTRQERSLQQQGSTIEQQRALLTAAGLALVVFSVLLGIILHISRDRKRVNASLRAAKQQAEAATEAKANFLASMSHEIRTPMNGIIGMVELLRQMNLGDEHRRMLQTIADSGQSLLTIINDILDFSKIEAGRLQLEVIPLSLIEIVEGSAETVAPAAQGKGLRLITFIDPGLPRLLGDPVRVRQLLVNLAGNAVKFTDRGDVEIRAVERGLQADSRLVVRFSVRDHGIGISAEAQKSLFTAFSQAESSTTRKYGGTGLGLSICQRLVQMMGGKIGVNSRLGEGSEFWADVPFQLDPESVAAAPTPKLDNLAVAVAAASELERDACRAYLEYWGSEVLPFAEPDAAIAEVRARGAAGRAVQVLVLGSDIAPAEQQAICARFEADPAQAGVRFVFLMRGRRRNVPRVVGNRVVTVDVGPLKREAFVSAVAIAAGRESPEVRLEEQSETLGVERVQSVEEAVRQGTLVLVAEDNPTNQDVITRQLSMLGYACDVVDNGSEALDALAQKQYGLLLTDCHMPVMDGYELTAQVRARETAGGRRLPIIATTANALQGEAEKCLAVGMDGYLSKPIRIVELREQLQRWLPPLQHATEQSGPVAAPAQPADAADPIDPAVLRDTLGEDEAMIHEVLADFVQPAREIGAAIRAAQGSGSAEQLWQAAHKLKSAARSVGANRLADLADELEQAGKQGRIDGVQATVDALVRALDEVVRYIGRK